MKKKKVTVIRRPPSVASMPNRQTIEPKVKKIFSPWKGGHEQQYRQMYLEEKPKMAARP